MWIIHCTELEPAELEHATRHFIVGPFGTDDQAEDTACKLQAEGHVSTDIQPLVEPARAMAGATF